MYCIAEFACYRALWLDPQRALPSSLVVTPCCHTAPLLIAFGLLNSSVTIG